MRLSISLSKQQLLESSRVEPRLTQKTKLKCCVNYANLYHSFSAMRGRWNVQRGTGVLGRWAVTNKREARQLCDGPSKNNMAPWPSRPFRCPLPWPAFGFPGLTAIDSSTLFCSTLPHFLFSLPCPSIFLRYAFFVKCQIFADSFDSLSKCARNFC